MKKAFLKILQNSHKNIFVDVSLPINLQALKKLRHGCFAKPSKTPISKNIRRRRLLILFLMNYERNYPIRGKNKVLTNYWQITLSDVLTNYFIMHSKNFQGKSRLRHRCFHVKAASDPNGSYLIKVNNRNITKLCQVCSNLKIKTLERRHWFYCWLSMDFHILFWCFHCRLWTSKMPAYGIGKSLWSVFFTLRIFSFSFSF